MIFVFYLKHCFCLQICKYWTRMVCEEIDQHRISKSCTRRYMWDTSSNQGDCVGPAMWLGWERSPLTTTVLGGMHSCGCPTIHDADNNCNYWKAVALVRENWRSMLEQATTLLPWSYYGIGIWLCQKQSFNFLFLITI